MVSHRVSLSQFSYKTIHQGAMVGWHLIFLSFGAIIRCLSTHDVKQTIIRSMVLPRATKLAKSECIDTRMQEVGAESMIQERMGLIFVSAVLVD